MTTRTIGTNTSKLTNLPECTYPPKDGVDKSHTYATVPRIMEYEIVPDTFSSPTRSLITTFRTLSRVIILAVGCTLSANSLLFAAELFPYVPPSSQQRSAEHQPSAWPPLSSEEKTEIETVNHSWHIGNATFVKNLCKSPESDLDPTLLPTRKLDGEGKLWLVQA